MIMTSLEGRKVAIPVKACILLFYFPLKKNPDFLLTFFYANITDFLIILHKKILDRLSNNTKTKELDRTYISRKSVERCSRGKM